MAALVIEEVLLLLERYAEAGFGVWRDEWQCYEVFLGAEVVVTGVGDAITGIAQGVDEHGALIIKTHAGTRLVHSGEVSLRKRDG